MINTPLDDHLSSILTQVLAIPMAENLPTPNSRKTCALSIWLLQVQRLPATVVGPAKDRIAYALRRGIEGELGKEGKKGSASDGLKVGCPHSHIYSFNKICCRLSMTCLCIIRISSSPLSPTSFPPSSRICLPPRFLFEYKHVTPSVAS